MNFLNNQYEPLTNVLNKAAFNGSGEVMVLGPHELHIHKKGGQQIIIIIQSKILFKNIVNVEWRFKYHHQEMVYAKNIYSPEKLSNIELYEEGAKIADEMAQQIKKHINHITPGVLNDFSELDT